DDGGEMQFEPVVTESDAPIGASPSVRAVAPRVTSSSQPIYTPPPLQPAAVIKPKLKRKTLSEERAEELERAKDIADCGLNTYDEAVLAPPPVREELAEGLFSRDPISVFGPGGWGKTTTMVTFAVAACTGSD